jgi:predicted amidohydrolase
MIWMRPDGSYARSDKRHLFSMGGEDRQFTRGTERTIVEIKGWKVLPLICYDMRFPAWSRNNFKDGSYDYDLVLYLSNWPEVRNHAWKTLLPARAIENQAYVVGLNRIGKDGHGKSHSGDSSVIDPGGVMVESLPTHQSAVCTVTLKAQALLDLRAEFPQGADMDRFTVL